MIKRTAAVWSPAAKATAGCAMPWKLRKRGKTTGLGLMMKGHLRENTKEGRTRGHWPKLGGNQARRTHPMAWPTVDRT